MLIAGGSANNTVGGTAAGAGNLISGNLGGGVGIRDAGTTGNVVLGNTINGSGGSMVIIDFGAANNTVGGVGGGRQPHTVRLRRSRILQPRDRRWP